MSDKRLLGRVLDTVSTLCVTGAALAIIWQVVMVGSNRPGPMLGAGAPSLVQNLESQKLSIALRDKPGEGKSTPRIAIIEFSDVECPFCGKHARETLPVLKREFVDNAKVMYSFVSFPLAQIHPNAFEGAKAMACARRLGRFWQMHDWLFQNQAKLSALVSSGFEDGGQGDRGEFAACMKEHAEGIVQEEMAEAHRLGVNSTPTFFVGRIEKEGTVSIKRRIAGAAPYEMFKQTLTELLNEPSAGSL